ncbi:MAG TPA: hypothetical protein PKD55_16920 [Bellilinea sp.]|nr:hypothetical protein [Bellilinea sp.]
MSPELNWNNLRTWDGSLHTAFEKLCCQLFSDDPPCSGAKYIEKGPGADAGVECFWQLPNGDEHGLQAKFFLDPPSDNQWSQIDQSVETALEKHPRLTRYVVCLPLERSDARQHGRRSMLDKWNERVTKWQGWSASRNMTVEFLYWGEHEIISRLTRGDDARGRWFFWFNQEFFDQKWFEDRLNQAVDTAGPRYTPPLNVELPIAKTFDGLGRTSAYFEDIFALYRQLKELFGHYRNKRIEALWPEQYQQLECQLQNLLAYLVTIPKCRIDETINFEVLETQINEARAAITAMTELAHQQIYQSDDHNNASENISKKDAEVALYALNSIDTALVSCLELIEGKPSKLANTPFMLLVGDAGTGKTHLFCDIAKKRLEAGLPTVLLVGEWFDSGEPWSQIIQHLHLPSLTMEGFLGALNTAAQIKNCRALIIIDALNESHDPRLWRTHLAAMLSNLERYPYLGMAISVRTPHDEVIVPSSINDSVIRVRHDGFAGFEYQAVKTFFDYYLIEQPSIPLLNPEFRNPLFLKLICEGLKSKGLTRLPSGLTGITSILDFFLDAANAEIADKLDYNPHINMVKRAIDDLIIAMIEVGDVQLPQEKAVSIVNQHLASQEYKRSLYYHMVSVGILAQYIDPFSNEFVTRFSYERFADHLIAKYLREQHIDVNNPAGAFAADQILGQILNGENRFRYSLITGLSVQLPETIGKELVEVAPYLKDDWYLGNAFMDSLIWRRWGTSDDIPEGTLSYINDHIVQSKHTHRELLDIFVSVATNPDNPFNADFLHEHLMGCEMAERDAWWSTFLHDHYDISNKHHGPINRLIDWALTIQDTSHLDREALRLTGIMLTWFLTSANRFLRDRATKALINLFDQEIPILIEVTKNFLDVNDLYVLERLFAVAYGCAMRSNDIEAISALAQNVYTWIFKDGSPPAHILLRDYANGVIEVALAKQATLDIEVDKIRPPYQGDWITDPPSMEDLENKYGIPTEEIRHGNRAQVHLLSSVSDWGDFARYIIGTESIFPWKPFRLSDPKVVSPRQKKKTFFGALSLEQKNLWEEYERARQQEVEHLFQAIKSDLPEVLEYPDLSEMSQLPTETEVGIATCDSYLDEIESMDEDGFKTIDRGEEQNPIDKLVEEWLEQLSESEKSAIQAAEDKTRGAFEHFRESLTPEQQQIFDNEIYPYIQDTAGLSVGNDQQSRFDISLAQRWILQKVFDLGWALERFGEFDEYVNYNNRRESKKPERIGKKYQWLAYHEFLARVSDTFQFGEDRWSDYPDEEYQGAWQLNVRDFDPSILITRTYSNRSTPNWWFQTPYDRWDESSTNLEWLRDAEGLPKPEELIPVKNPSDNSDWFVMQSSYEWAQPLPRTEKLYESPTRRIWYHLQSYIVKKSDADEFFEWVIGHSMKQWMPESFPIHKVFLGEFFWSSAFEYHINPRVGSSDWETLTMGNLEVPVVVTAAEYLWEDIYDCSIDDSIHIYTPSRWLADQMGLKWQGIDGQFHDSAHRLIALDPSIYEEGPQTLLFRKDAIFELLAKQEVEIFWIVLGQKDVMGHNPLDGYPGQLRINGVYRLYNGEISGTLRSEFIPPNPAN